MGLWSTILMTSTSLSTQTSIRPLSMEYTLFTICSFKPSKPASSTENRTHHFIFFLFLNTFYLHTGTYQWQKYTLAIIMQYLKIYKPNKSVETFRSRSLCCRRSSSDTLFPWKVILMVFDSFPRMPDATNLKVEAGRSQTVTIGIMEAGDKPSSVQGV